MKGKIFTFIGLDGAGKSTQAFLLEKWLKEKGYLVENTRMKDFQKISNKELIMYIRENGLKISNGNEMEILRSALSMRKKVKDEMLDCVFDGKIIITDRFLETNYIFARILDLEASFLDSICKDIIDMVDIQFFINVPPELCYNRILKREQMVKFHESIENLNCAYKYYLENAPKKNCIIIDGNRSREEIHKDICTVIARKLKGEDQDAFAE